jgi:hypothetical protein
LGIEGSLEAIKQSMDDDDGGGVSTDSMPFS